MSRKVVLKQSTLIKWPDSKYCIWVYITIEKSFWLFSKQKISDHHDGRCNDDGLSDLQTIDSGQNVDRVRTEDRQHAHVDVVQQAQVNVRP